MSEKYSKIKLFFYKNHKKINSELIDIGVKTEKRKKNFIGYITRNKNNKLNFPIIYTFNKNNDLKKLYHFEQRSNSNFYINENNLKLFKNYNINDSIRKTKKDYLNLKVKDAIYTKINLNNQINKKSSAKKICDNLIENKKDSNSVRTPMKTPQIDLFNINNISNINNIYDKNDFLKYKINNKNKSFITIKNLKKSNTDVNLKEDGDSIIKFLNKTSSINFKSNLYKPKKFKYTDRFKKLLKEVVEEYNRRNKTKIKKRINTSILLINNKNDDIINENKNNELEINNINIKKSKININEKKNNDISKLKKLKKYDFNSKLSKNNIKLLTENINFKKRRSFLDFKFTKNKKTISDIEQKMEIAQNKFKENVDIFKKKLDNLNFNIIEEIKDFK